MQPSSTYVPLSGAPGNSHLNEPAKTNPAGTLGKFAVAVQSGVSTFFRSLSPNYVPEHERHISQPAAPVASTVPADHKNDKTSLADNVVQGVGLASKALSFWVPNASAVGDAIGTICSYVSLANRLDDMAVSGKSGKPGKELTIGSENVSKDPSQKVTDKKQEDEKPGKPVTASGTTNRVSGPAMATVTLMAMERLAGAAADDGGGHSSASSTSLETSSISPVPKSNQTQTLSTPIDTEMSSTTLSVSSRTTQPPAGSNNGPSNTASMKTKVSLTPPTPTPNTTQVPSNSVGDSQTKVPGPSFTSKTPLQSSNSTAAPSEPLTSSSITTGTGSSLTTDHSIASSSSINATLAASSITSPASVTPSETSVTSYETSLSKKNTHTTYATATGSTQSLATGQSTNRLFPQPTSSSVNSNSIDQTSPQLTTTLSETTTANTSAVSPGQTTLSSSMVSSNRAITGTGHRTETSLLSTSAMISDTATSGVSSITTQASVASNDISPSKVGAQIAGSNPGDGNNQATTTANVAIRSSASGQHNGSLPQSTAAFIKAMLSGTTSQKPAMAKASTPIPFPGPALTSTSLPKEMVTPSTTITGNTTSTPLPETSMTISGMPSAMALPVTPAPLAGTISPWVVVGVSLGTAVTILAGIGLCALSQYYHRRDEARQQAEPEIPLEPLNQQANN